ncbi:MAG TPA: DUF2336 domain-containing protein [Pseudolabrys sp.]|nr:DUF2336 domain-containing protein [Pseudolabrys sp.]
MNIPALLDELNDAITHGTAERRAVILTSITDIFVAAAPNYSEQQIDVFDDVFLRLADTIEHSARAVLAERLSKVERAPAKVSRSLANDDDIDVAGPMLQHARGLDNTTLVTVARTKPQQHLLAISRRQLLDETITDVLVERGEKPVVLSTANNPTARFSDAGYTKLVQRSEGDDELAATVGLRTDIPRAHLMRLLAQASDAVRVKLEMANPAMAATITEAIAEAADMILDQSGGWTRNYATARTHVEFLRAAGQLGESEIAEFARANKVEEAVVAISVTSRAPIDVIEKAMDQPQPEALLILAKACGMSWPAAKAILRLRSGPRAVSPAELEQCEDSYSRLKPVTARQVIDLQGRPRGADGAFRPPQRLTR